MFMTIRIRVLALALIVSLSGQASAQAPAADKEQVLATIHGFLKGLHTKDTALMASHVDTLSRFTLLRPGPNGVQVISVMARDFIKLVANPNQPALDEPIRNPVVQLDADLATVWAEYQVRRPDGTVSHCGYDAFHLARLGGSWKILNVSDTFRRTGCGAAWPKE
jgi:hypothetical protein